MKTLAVSFSESPDLEARGLLPEHLTHVALELARYVIDAGHRLAYGGDLRDQGFTGHLVALVALHGHSDEPSYARLDHYLSWPFYIERSDDERRRLRAAATQVPVPPPEDLVPDPSTPPTPEAAETPYLRARSLTAMRRTMSRDTHARILIAGRVADYLGYFPGVAEEAYWTIREGKPLFLMGGFGGATAAVIEALRGGTPSALAPDTLRKHARKAAAKSGHPLLDDVYRKHGAHEWVELDMSAVFRDSGVAGLNNGLSAEENAVLFETVDPLEAAALVLRGLSAVPTE